MGQIEIQEFLRKNKDKKFTARQISEKLNVRNSTVSINMMGLRKYGFVHYELGTIKTPSKDNVKTMLYWYNKDGG